MRYLPLLLALAGCASYPTRMDVGAYRIIVAAPEQVSAHCHQAIARAGARHDNGDPVNPYTEIRACATFKTPGKPTVFVSKKWIRCARHEACHAMFPLESKMCGEMVPCLGEGKPSQEYYQERPEGKWPIL